jgi:hypothetical protein
MASGHVHERNYLAAAMADPNEELTKKDFQAMEKAGGNWLCYLMCYAEYKACRTAGGTKEECRLKLAECLLKCKTK